MQGEADINATDHGAQQEHDRAEKARSGDYETRGWAVQSASAARDATKHEHEMSIMQALKLYPKACFWSCVVSFVVIMDGYDTALIGTLMGFPAFKERFGINHDNRGYQIEAKWQTALGLASPLGNVVGIFLNANMTERWGHKKTLLGTIVFLTACIFIDFFALNIQMIFAGELLCGLAWGVFTTMGPAYVSEVTPVVLRAYLETYVVLCWGIGQLISYGVLDGLVHRHFQWAWRIPFAVQWVFPVIIVPLICFCPESPWWLVRKGRLEEAEQAVGRLSSNPDPESSHNAVALMVETTELERSMMESATWLDCFRGPNWWRTEIGCVAWLAQVLVGFAITSYASYFFEQAGLSDTNAYKFTVGQGCLHFVCVLLSVFITARHGRRPIFIGGVLFMSLTMFIIGFLSFAPNETRYGYASATVYLCWYCAYEMTLGPASFIIVGETSSTRLRSKSIALGRNAYNVFNIASFCVAPYVLNPYEANWKGKTAFLAAGFALIIVLWAYFRLPELKDRTYEEIDILFTKNLKAKDFSKYQFNRETEVEAKLAEIEHQE